MKPGIGKYVFMALVAWVWPLIVLMRVTDERIDKLPHEQKDVCGFFMMMALLILWIFSLAIVWAYFDVMTGRQIALALFAHWLMGIATVLITLRKKYREMITRTYNVYTG